MKRHCPFNICEMNENEELNPSQMPPFQDLIPQSSGHSNPPPLPNRNENSNDSEQDRMNRAARLFEQADRIMKSLQTPQAVRELQPFNGNPVKLHSFLRSVENLMPFIEPLKDTPYEKIWLQAIRSKITEEADQVLETYGTPLNWNSIKENLIAYYNDKRDSVTLTRELFQIQQTGSIEHFFGQVQNLLSLLINNANITTQDENVKNDRNRTHKENALQVFLAGLKEPIGGNVRARQPRNIKQAFDAAIEERNFQSRTGLTRPTLPPRLPKPINFFPQFQPRQPNFNPQPFVPRQPYQFQSPPMRQNFVPRFSNPQQGNNTYNNQPQKALQAPEPTNTDRSIRSKYVNYVNRPPHNYNARSQRSQFIPAVPPRPARLTELRNIEQIQEGAQEAYAYQCYPSTSYDYDYHPTPMDNYSYETDHSESYLDHEQEAVNETPEQEISNDPVDNLNFQLEGTYHFPR